MITPENVYGMLGRVSVLFSTLEADVGDLLCVLVHPDEPLLAATVLERTSFSKSLDLLENVSHFQNPGIERQIVRLLAIAKPLRKRRNLFVHGRWNLSPKFLDQGKVAVSESKIEFTRSENRKTWHKGKNHIFTYEDLREYQGELMRAIKLTGELLQKVDGSV